MTEEYLRLLLQEKQLLEQIMDAAPNSEAKKVTLVRQGMVAGEIEDLMYPKKKKTVAS